jgi:hypothetical protein
MALQLSIALMDNFGESITFNDAYVKVARIEATNSTAAIYVTVMRSAIGPVLENRMHWFVPDLSGENHIRQAYLYLKTLPEFASATDC